MRYPRFIQAGDTIGFAAPSFGCATEPYRSAFEHALEVFTAKGVQTLCGPNALASEGTGISSTPERCGRELTEMYCSDDCDAIISCGGGELMCESIGHVDFEAVRKAEPKWFMGFSDNTNFTFLLPTLCDTAAIYGPCAPSFGMEPWHPAIGDAWDLLGGRKLETEGYPCYETESLKTEENPLEPYHCTELRKILAYVPENGGLREASEELRFSGRLIGGCLDCLQTLCGTEFDRAAAFAETYREDGILWFLEACDLNVFGIRRALWQLKHSGWFRHVRGFLIGRPLAGREELMGLDHVRAVTEALQELQVPILLDVDLGHVPPMMPLISGAMADVAFRPSDGSIRLGMRLD